MALCGINKIPKLILKQRRGESGVTKSISGGNKGGLSLTKGTLVEFPLRLVIVL